MSFSKTLGPSFHRVGLPSRGADFAALVLSLALGVLTCPLATWALDFQLHSKAVNDDGQGARQDYFQHDAANYAYITLPVRWSRVDEPNSLTLTAPDPNRGSIRLETSPTPPSTKDFSDKDALEAYRRRALATVPRGAVNVKTEEHDLPIDFYHWRDYEFVVSYDFFGQSCQRSVIFLDLDSKQQIMVTTVAPTVNFSPAHGTVLTVLRSWQVIPVGR